MTRKKFTAGDRFPVFSLPAVTGGAIEVGTPQGDNDWQLVVVYRGRHCPMCTTYLAKLEDLKNRFHDLKVDVVAVSGDPREKAHDQVEKGNLTIPVAYDLSIDQMLSLGLYVSHPRSPAETDRPFSEPGLFVINGEGAVQVLDTSNAPFTRPDLEILLGGLEFIRDSAKNYPIRGTY